MRNKPPGLTLHPAARGRAGLLRTTALQAAFVLVFASPAIAQPAPTARPAGGIVVGGTASIGQTAAQTTVAQSTQRAAIDWRSFDVGSAHAVQFQQPNSTAVILNRVTGPDPSQIAGRISANGQVVITNQSGVVFHQGSQVDAAGLIVSAAGITTPNFMAGRMVFDIAPRPDAAVTNAGTITVKEAGLAALVAPRVANSGVISARMGRAVLAGAETHTVDLYGDGLLSIDVTGQVRQAPRGPDGKPVTALVTNTGTVVADGGSVTLTAAAADGLVQTLVQAGGRLQANAAEGRPGTVIVAGVGGSVRIEGRVSTNGGGTVLATATDAVTVAAPARITANGGTVIIGNRTATRTVTVEPGATIAANARLSGNGGTVKLLSSGTTTFDGRVFARGGRERGDGGAVEISGGTVALTGRVDAGAPHGTAGNLLIDPTDVTISSTGGAGTVITPASIEAQTANVTVQADNSIVVSSSVNLANPGASGPQTLTLDAGNFARVDAGVTVAASGGVTFQTAPGGVSLLGNVTGRLRLRTTGAITQGAGSVVDTTLIDGTVGSLALTSTSNVIQAIGGNNRLVAGTGDIAITTTGLLEIQGGYVTAGVVVPSGRTMTLVTDLLRLTPNGGALLSAPNGTIALRPLTANRPIEVGAAFGAANPNALAIDGSNVNNLQSTVLQLGSATTGAVNLNANGVGVLLDYGAARTLVAQSAAGITQTAAIRAGSISGAAASIDLSNGGNTIPVIAGATAPGGFALHTGAALTVSGAIASSATVNLSSTGTMTLAADITGATVRLDSYNGTNLGTSGDIVRTAGSLTATSLEGQGRTFSATGAAVSAIGDFHTATGFTLGSTGPLNLTGTLLNDAGTVQLNIAGAITQAAASTLRTPTLTGGATDAAFTSATNLVSTLGAFAATGDFALTTTLGGTAGPPPLVVAGAVSAGTGRTAAITADGVLFGTGATIAAPGGTVAFAPLTAARPVELTSGAATIGALSLSQAAIDAVTATTLRIGSAASGALTAGKAGETVDLTGHATALTLLSSGAVTQGAGAVLVVPTLAATAASLTLGGANRVSTLAGVATTGAATLNSALALSVTGPVAAGGALSIASTVSTTVQGSLSGTSVALSAGTGGVALAGGALSTAGTLSFNTTGAVTQPGGTVTAGTLTATAGSLALTQAGNQITSLGTVSTAGAGTLDLVNARALTIDGDVFVANATLGVTGALAFNNAFQSNGTLAVNATGAVTQGTNGRVLANTLTGTAASVQLDGTNSVGSLGAWTTTSGFSFNNVSLLTVAGPVTDQASVRITASSPGDTNTPPLNVNGSITAPTITLRSIRDGTNPNTGDMVLAGGRIQGTTVQLLSQDGIVQTGGTIAAGTLGLSGAGAILLDSTTNQIGTLAAATSVGGLRVRDNQALTVTGPVTDTTSITLNAAGLLTLNGTLNAPTVSLTSAGVTQSAGTVTATTLSGTSTGAVALNQAGNAVTNLGAYTAVGGFQLVDAQPLTVAGAVSVSGANPALSLSSNTIALGAAGSLSAPGGTVTLAPATTGTAFALSSLGGTASAVTADVLQVGNGQTGALSIGGPTNLSGVATLRLVSGTSITETGAGALTANRLEATAPVVTLGGANRIATLGDVGTTGAFTLTNAQALDLAGAVNVGTTATLNVTGALTQSTGSLAAATLAGQAASIALNQPGNLIVNLGNLVATTSLSIRDARSLTITGVVDPPDMTLTVAGDLAINNTITAGALTLAVTGNVTESPTGFVTATSLQGSAASVRLDRLSIDTLGAFTSTGGLTLVNNKLLTVTGPVTDATSVALTGNTAFGFGDALRIAGNVTAPTVTLVSRASSTPGASNGNIVQSSGLISATTLSMTSIAGVAQTGGGITAGTVTVAGQNYTVLLDSPTNQIGTLGAASAVGGLRVRDNQALTVAGPVTDTASIAFDVTGPLTLAGTVNAPAVTLAATGAITQTAGAITTTTLTGTAGSAALNQPANAIANLGAFTSAGAFSLVDGAPLRVTGAVSAAGPAPTLALSSDTITLAIGGSLTAANGTVTLAPATPGAAFPLASLVAGGATSAVSADTLQIGNAATGPITVDGAFNLSGTGTLRFVSSGAVTETATGAITANTLAVSAASATLAGANRFTILGATTTTGAFTLANAQALNLTGAIDAGGTMRLDVTGALTQTAGSITAPTLAGTAASVSLTQANQVTNLGPFASTGAFAFTDARALTIAGPVSGADTTLSAAGDLAINNAVSGATVILTSGGAITEGAGGSVAATTLRGAATSARLDQTNQVATLGSFATTTGLTLRDAAALTVAGPVTDGAAISLASTGPLTLSGAITAPSVALSATRPASGGPGTIAQTTGTVTATQLNLVAADGITQPGGALSATTLIGSAGGAVSLDQPTNAVTGLGAFTGSGAFSLRTAGALSLSGALSAPTVNLATGGALTQPGGAIATTTLTGSSVGTATLGQPGNAITNLGAFTAAGAFTLVDGSPLTIAGAVQATGPTPAITLSSNTITLASGGSLAAANGTVTLAPATPGAAFPLSSLVAGGATSAVSADTLQIGNAATGPITVDGAFNLSGTNTLRLVSSGAITETTTGAITANTLAATAAFASLGGANRFATLGDVTTTGAFTLANARALNLVGTIAAGTTVQLDVTGALTQTAGSITATTLAGSAGSVSLTQGANRIAQLGPFVTIGDFALTDGRSLTVIAPVDPGDVTITVNGDLVLNSSVTANTLTFLVTGTITEGTQGSVIATTLRGSAASARLDQSNQVGALADFSTTSGFTLRDGTALAVTGPVVDGASIALSSIGAMTLSGAVTAPNVALTTIRGDIVQSGGTITAPATLTLASAGAVSQPGGAILAGALTGSSTTTTTLNQAANRIGTLATYASAGGFSLRNGQSLAQSGTAADTVRIALNVTGGLSLAGTIAAPTIDLAATGAITQPGGALIADTLTGAAGSAALNQGANAITSLGAFTAGGAFSLVDGTPLTVSAPVSATGTLALASDSIRLQPGASLSAPGGTVALSTRTPGAPLSLTSFVPATTTSAITADTLQVGSLATGDITIGGTFNLPNVGTLNLVSAGSITESTGGSLQVGRLTATGTTIRLDGQNAVATLGPSTASGAFTLVNAATTPLLVAGAVSGAGGISLSAPSITLGTAATPGTLTTPGTVTLAAGALAGNTVDAVNGGITAGSLSASAWNVSLGGTNRVAALTGITATGQPLNLQSPGGNILFVNQAPLTVTGPLAAPGLVTLQTSGALTLAGAIGADTLTVIAGNVAQTGGLVTANTLNLTSSGDAILSGRIARLGTILVPGTFGLTDLAPTLTIAGVATVGTLNLAGAPAVVLTGVVTANATTLDVASFVQTGNTFQTGTLRGTSAGPVQLGTSGGTTTIGTLSDISASSIDLANAGPLTLAGAIRAPTLSVSAPRSITIQGGAITAGTATLAVTGPGGTLGQTGTTTFTPGTTARATVRLSVDRGTIALNNLVGTTTNLVLAMNAGRATGTLAVADLLVSDEGGSAALLGSVGGRTGFDAAIASRITVFDTAYTMNGCAIASASCVAIVPPTPTPAPPPTPDQPSVRVVFPSTIRPDIVIVQDFLRTDLFTTDLVTIDITRNPSDPDFALPNISDRDY